MKRHGALIILLALSALGLLAGCWGTEKSTSVGLSTTAAPTAVGVDICLNCHSTQSSLLLASRHGNSNNSPEYPADASCNTCHDPLGDGARLSGTWGGIRNLIGCESCHGGGSEHFGLGPINSPSAGVYAVAATDCASSQYNTCTQCHPDTAAGNYHGEVERAITDTHFDNANRAIGSDIQGYVIRKTSDTACVDCHNPHTANMANSQNVQWHASKHGNFTGEGWKHYQWTASNRTSCQRCHTTTGLINFLANQTTYDPANNVFSWLTSTATDNRSEMLYCYGCHTNYYGGLRTPGPITATYAGVSPEPVFPNVAGSNICLACHTGRESGLTIKASTGNFDNLSFINSHYLTAGATLFATSGFEYDNMVYPGPLDHDHANIGSTSAPGTGSNGPCVGCHMTSPTNAWDPTQGKHRFLPTGTGSGGTEVVTSTVCVECHGGLMSITELDVAKEEALAGLAILDNVLRARGYFFANTHPYFFKTAGSTASSNAVKKWTNRFNGTAGDNTIGKMNMGAAFNYNLFAHDPGFFAHNDIYTKRVIYDTIDWLDNNSMDNTVQSYITNNFPVGQTRTDALLYFGGSGRP